MSVPGAIVIIADESAAALREAAAGFGAPVVTARPRGAEKAIGKLAPVAVVLADRDDPAFGDAIAAALAASGGPLVPMIAVAAADRVPSPHCLPILPAAVAQSLVARLRAAQRVRTLHGAVLRRIAALAEQGVTPPELPVGDPLDDATVLVAGRGKNYPAITAAVAERMSLIGAFSLETARSYLAARDIDGIIIGDGFNRAPVEHFLADLAADPRWRDLAVIVPASVATAPDPEQMPNVERVSASPAELAARILPFARLHAFAARLKRVSLALDQSGLIDPESGLMLRATFMRDLDRAVTDARARGTPLALARLTLDTATNRRASLDAARIAHRLVRASDLACRDADGSILIAFTETDLGTAHVAARRIASVLKHTVSGDRAALSPTVALAARKGDDTAASLLARTADTRLVAAE